jgi:hypothetical protein
MGIKLVVKDSSSLYTKFTIKPEQARKRLTSDFLIGNVIMLIIFFKINPLPWKTHVEEEVNIKLLFSFAAVAASNLLLVILRGNSVVKGKICVFFLKKLIFFYLPFKITSKESLIVIKKIGV